MARPSAPASSFRARERHRYLPARGRSDPEGSNVSAGALGLAGTGTVSGTTINAAGIFAPGATGTPGTITVARQAETDRGGVWAYATALLFDLTQLKKAPIAIR
jgi:hypothetical protein